MSRNKNAGNSEKVQVTTSVFWVQHRLFLPLPFCEKGNRHKQRKDNDIKNDLSCAARYKKEKLRKIC